MKQITQSAAVKLPPLSTVTADDPTEQVFSPLSSVGSLIRNLFRRTDTRWYSTEHATLIIRPIEEELAEFSDGWL